MDLFGGRMGFDAPDHLEHCVTRTGEAEAPVPQGSLRAYHARLADALHQRALEVVHGIGLER
jgi:hypothetical protein